MQLGAVGNTQPRTSLHQNASQVQTQFTQSVQELISTLGIKADQVQVRSEPGGKSQIQSGIQVVQTLNLDASKLQMMRHLGLGDAPIQMAMAVFGAATLKKLKDGLKEIEENLEDENALNQNFEKISEALGIENPSAFVFVTEEGGITLLENIESKVK